MRAFVDRLDDGMATLLLGDDESVTVTVPVAWLPAGTAEGLVLQLDWRLDPEATADAKAATKSLLDALGNQP
jgi:hypothetical protein